MRAFESSFYKGITLYEVRVAKICRSDDDFEVFLIKPVFLILIHTS